MPIAISELLDHMQPLFQQVDGAKVAVEFRYTPAPGSWQAAVQSGGLSGLMTWLRDSDAQATTPSAKDGTTLAGSVSTEVREAVKHIGQLFAAMLHMAPAEPAAKQPAAPSPESSPESAKQDAAAAALQAFNQMLKSQIPAKAQQTADPADKSANPADWKYWTDKGLDAFNSLLSKAIESTTGKSPGAEDHKHGKADVILPDKADTTAPDEASDDKNESDTSEEASEDYEDSPVSDTPYEDETAMNAYSSRPHLLDV